MPNIYQIEAELAQIAEAYDQLEGQEIGEDVLAAVEEYFGDLLRAKDKKVDNYYRIIEELKAKASIRKAESERLAKRAKSAGMAAEALKKRLFDFMEVHGLTKLEGSVYSFAIVGNGGQQPMTIDDAFRADPEKAPDEYLRTIIELDTEVIRYELTKHETAIKHQVSVFEHTARQEFPKRMNADEKAQLAGRVAAYEKVVRDSTPPALTWARLEPRGKRLEAR